MPVFDVNAAAAAAQAIFDYGSYEWKPPVSATATAVFTVTKESVAPCRLLDSRPSHTFCMALSKSPASALSDLQGADVLLKSIRGKAVIADKASDAQARVIGL